MDKSMHHHRHINVTWIQLFFNVIKKKQESLSCFVVYSYFYAIRIRTLFLKCLEETGKFELPHCLFPFFCYTNAFFWWAIC